ncbi:MAG TPA: protein kinase [Kofleriaceae bacterium]|nr:protein kinase [Kofleriaceae bacterium]
MHEGAQVGSYRVLSQIGQGGMGSVWLAEHITLGRRAALKVLHPEFSVRAEIVQRFFNEARAATSIQDPGIVQIFDFGQDQNGSAYIVMELLDGDPLDRRLDRGALAVPDALRIMRQVASSLGAAHARGIVHRDLKPENIFLVRDPEVAGGERAKVLDFGIAKLVGENTGMRTHTSAVMGTPTYMSPEQCRGAGQVDQRSDVYALGCVLFHLLCGRPPFHAAGGGEIIAMHLREAPPVPSSLRSDIPREVDQLILHCLQKDPAHRFASGAELAIALGALIGSAPRIETGPIYTAQTIPAVPKPTTLSSATGASSVTSTRKSRVAVIAGVAVAVGVAGIGGFVAVSKKPADKTTAAETKDEAAGSAATETKVPEVAAAAPIDPNADVKRRIADVIAKFATWSHDHAGAACPDVATIGVTGDDGWGHPLRITCTDQPADQIIGVVSLGPDGQPGTDDDVASWQLGKEVTSTVRGARWVTVAQTVPDTAKTNTAKTETAKAETAKTDTAKTTKATTKTSTTNKTHKTTKAGDTKVDKGPKIELDENGLPISR